MDSASAVLPPPPSSVMISIPDVLMDRLSCSKCKNLLSVYPIHSTADGSGICGRCFDVKNPEGIRNKIYETLLEFITFPCMNKQFGCMESRAGKDMYKHETRCRYRRINCPTFINTSCDWIGEIDNLLEHFESSHARNLLKQPSFEVNFVHNYEEIFLLPYADSLFLVRKHGNVEVNMFWCSVQTVFTNENENYEYFITLKNPSSGLTVELPKKMAISLNDTDGVQINPVDIQETLKNPSIIIASIDIVDAIKISSNKITKLESDYLSENNLEMLKIIECPVCFEYMVPPIYQCEGGHSICGECRNKVKQCPTCRKPFGDTQNYAVESFTSFLKYPCKNFERGCEFISPAKEIKVHEKLCSFGIYQCPTSDYTSCKWSGLKQDVWNHCKNDHIDNVMETTIISMPFDEADQEVSDRDCFILKFLQNIFILHWRYRSDEKLFLWSIQLLGPREESKDYYFDLDIIDRRGGGMRIYLRCPCESFTGMGSAFGEGKQYLYLYFDQVEHLVNEVFCFKVMVYKNQ